MEGSWSFEYKLLESDPLLPSPPRSHILLSGKGKMLNDWKLFQGDFKKAKLQAKSVTRRGKEITISEPHDYDQGSCLILTFAKHFTHKKLKLSIFLIWSKEKKDLLFLSLFLLTNQKQIAAEENVASAELFVEEGVVSSSLTGLWSKRTNDKLSWLLFSLEFHQNCASGDFYSNNEVQTSK